MWHVTHDTWHVTRDTWHVTHDRWEEVKLLSTFQLANSYGLGVRGEMWHLTCDTWHLTPDMCHNHMTHRGWWTLCQNSSSIALTVWVWRCFEDSELRDDRISQLINNEDVCRTAPATPGLLKIQTPALTTKKKDDKTFVPEKTFMGETKLFLLWDFHQCLFMQRFACAQVFLCFLIASLFRANCSTLRKASLIALAGKKWSCMTRGRRRIV